MLLCEAGLRYNTDVKLSPVFLATWLLMMVISACNPTVVTPSPTSAPATVTPTVTPTIDWFPATATPTPQLAPELTATPDLRPALGEVLLDEGFEAKDWLVGTTTAGAIALEPGAITLAVAETAGRLYTLRQGTMFGDFYMEVTANLSLCRGADAYGVIFRANSNQAFYRLWLNCQGEMRLERIRGSEVGVMQDWTPGTSIPMGAPITVPVSIVARGTEIQVYANGVYQFSVKDPLYASGTIGFAARAAGDSPVTVTFSDLKVYGLAGN